MSAIVKELIELRILKNKLIEKEKQLIQSLIDDTEFDKYNGDDALVYKSTTRTVKFKEWVEEDFVMGMYPQYVKKSIDMKELRKDERAHDLLELNETQSLTVKLK